MKRSLIAVIVLALTIGSGVLIWNITKPKQAATAAGGGGSHGHGGGPAQVKVVTAKVQQMPVVLEGIGTVEAEQSVQVRAQVAGTLDKVLFHEGDLVHAGQVLFQLDPRQFQDAVGQAQAVLARDAANAREAQAQQARLSSLVKQEYVTRQEYSQAVATAQANTATVRADQAALKQAQLQLGYATIRAPITGRAGSLQVKAGNLVAANSTTPLVIINSIQPTLVTFTIPQQALPAVQAAQHTHGPLKVDVSRQAGQPPIANGKLVFIDNTVNVQTGTVTLKAESPNTNEALWPGEFVAVRLVENVEPHAITVPAVAVQMGQQGAFVYVVDHGRARSQPVTVSRQVDQLDVIASGLKGGDQVITEYPSNMQEGSPVIIGKPGGPAAGAQQPTAAQGR